MAKTDNSGENTIVQYRVGPKTTLAKHDSAHCLAPGLFRSLKRGDHRKHKLHIIYKFGPKELFEFKGPEPLGAEDLLVLQGLVAMAGAKHIIVTDDIKNEKAIGLLKGLDRKWDAANHGAMAVNSSIRKLARETGYDPDSGGALKTIQDCIERLWTVSIIVQQGNKRLGFNMLSSYGNDSKSGKLLVALNCRVATAIFGLRPYTRINMDEVRKLKTGPARILHQRLCCIISQGQTKKILPETLISYIWPNAATGSTLRTRRQVLRKALAEIAATDAWIIKEGYQITRKGDFKKKLKPKTKQAT